MHPGPDSAWIRVEWVEKGFREEKVAPETSAAPDPPKSKYAAGPSRFAASRSPVKSWRFKPGFNGIVAQHAKRTAEVTRGQRVRGAQCDALR